MSTSTTFIDGSKFEANANKYQWVWKKAQKISLPLVYKDNRTF